MTRVPNLRRNRTPPVAPSECIAPATPSAASSRAVVAVRGRSLLLHGRMTRCQLRARRWNSESVERAAAPIIVSCHLAWRFFEVRSVQPPGYPNLGLCQQSRLSAACPRAQNSGGIPGPRDLDFFCHLPRARSWAISDPTNARSTGCRGSSTPIVWIA